MVIFKNKNLLEKQKSLGEQLKEAREKQHLSIDKIVKILGIKKNYIISLENNNLENLPGGLYPKKFIKQYSKYLELDQKEIDKFIENNLQKNKNKKYYFSRKKIKRNKFLVFPKIIRSLFVVIIVLIFIFYLGFYFNNLITPPNLKIIYPPNNYSTDSKKIVIKGKSEKETEILINKTPVLIEDAGYFEKEINLNPGLNEIIVESKKKYSKTNIKTRQILVK